MLDFKDKHSKAQTVSEKGKAEAPALIAFLYLYLTTKQMLHQVDIVSQVAVLILDYCSTVSMAHCSFFPY